MKRQFFRLPALLVMAFGLTLASCSKDGEAGPQGDQGEQGQKGDKGDKGGQGEQGEAGTANVIYSNWLDVNFQLNTDSSAYVATINAPLLVDSILAKGEIKVYLNLGSAADPAVVPLPYFNGTVIINPIFFPQQIGLVSNINPGTVTDNGVKYQQYRYILIPGGTTGRTSVDWNNYEAVKAHLGLKD